MTLPELAITNEAITGVSAVAVHFPPLSCKLEDAPKTAGVVVEIAAADLEKYDAREIGYERVRVEPLDRVFLPGGGDPVKVLGVGAVVWCYASPAVGLKTPLVPNADFPIIQSYLDVMLDGCWTVGGEEFARNFLLTTHGWNTDQGAYLNDRKAPGYIRYSSAAAAHADQWDALLEDTALLREESGFAESTCFSLLDKTSAPGGAQSIIKFRVQLP